MTSVSVFNGKNALVTGASRGIGAAAALALCRAGADVCLVARSHKELQATLAKCKKVCDQVSAAPTSLFPPFIHLCVFIYPSLCICLSISMEL